MLCAFTWLYFSYDVDVSHASRTWWISTPTANSVQLERSEHCRNYRLGQHRLQHRPASRQSQHLSGQRQSAVFLQHPITTISAQTLTTTVQPLLTWQFKPPAPPAVSPSSLPLASPWLLCFSPSFTPVALRIRAGGLLQESEGQGRGPEYAKCTHALAIP